MTQSIPTVAESGKVLATTVKPDDPAVIDSPIKTPPSSKVALKMNNKAHLSIFAT